MSTHGKVNATLPKGVLPEDVDPGAGARAHRRSAPAAPQAPAAASRAPAAGPRKDGRQTQTARRPEAAAKKKRAGAAEARKAGQPRRIELGEESPQDQAQPGLPTRERLLAFIADHPGEAGKRDIARAFGITGTAARIPLKAMLKELAKAGLVERRRKRLKRPSDLPSVTVLERDRPRPRRRVPRRPGRLV